MDYHVVATRPIMDATTAIHLAGVCYVIAIAAIVWFIMGASKINR